MNTEEQFEKIWQSVCQKVKSYSEVSASQVDAFFSRLHIQAMSADFIAITAETEFIKDWIEQYYLRYIKTALTEMFGSQFTVLLELSTPSAAASSPAVATVSLQPTATPLPAVEVTPTMEAQAEIPQTDESDDYEEEDDYSILQDISPLTFENFVIGNSNQMAYKMALSVAEAPGKKKGLNPLFIYGRSGLGKTHLLRAIQNHIQITFPQLNVIYVDSSEFLDEYTEASAAHDKNKRSFSTFKSRYEEADVLLIDDVQFFQGKKGTLDNMFQIFNKLTNRGKQVVLSADRAPKNIDIDERYRSRFQSGGTYDIQPPEIETKLGIIKSYIDEYKASDPEVHFTISPEVQSYIAENSSSNIRELKGAVTVVITSLINDPHTTMEEIRQLLQNHFSGGMVKLSIADVQAAVEQFYQVKHADLIGKKRSQDIAYPRQICIYLCREVLDDVPFKQIGEAFGRDHSTAVYAHRNIGQKISESRETQEEIEALLKIINDR